MKPVLSVIMITKNSANTISSALKSLHNQSYHEFELIVQDGASTDATLNIVESFNFENNSVLSELDSGLYNALNNAIRRARGQYIMFLHSDDKFSSSTVLADIAKYIGQHQPDILYGNVTFTGKKRKPWISGEFSQRKLRYGWMAPHTSIVVKRTFHEALGQYDESLKISSDYEYELRAFLTASNIIYVNMNFCCMTTDGTSNGTLRKFLTRLIEDYEVTKRYFKYPIFVILAKRVRKLSQFV